MLQIEDKPNTFLLSCPADNVEVDKLGPEGFILSRLGDLANHMTLVQMASNRGLYEACVPLLIEYANEQMAQQPSLILAKQRCVARVRLSDSDTFKVEFYDEDDDMLGVRFMRLFQVDPKAVAKAAESARNAQAEETTDPKIIH